ncbi:MAG: hypothetical protein AUG44_26135 [Actinobacteria bacterium 13_1_20CM_3_71_11]|nr:MAG: hypothetical protein AUG44_26135 [Actinobacteria bacterium 13_1_20CM_3_71_11]
MDLFARTFLPAATDAGLDMPAISRHLPVFRRCLGADTVLLVSRCTRPDRPLSGEHVLVLSRHRLVVTHESRLVHKLRLHLDAPIHELADVRWTPDALLTSVELAATAIDGIRERFTLKVRHPELVWHLDELFGQIFTRSLANAA